jgi:hypothetical protein
MMTSSKIPQNSLVSGDDKLKDTSEQFSYLTMTSSKIPQNSLVSGDDKLKDASEQFSI